MGERSAVKHRNAGEMITFEDFVDWISTGTVRGVNMTTMAMYHAIQARIWVCPVCKEEGFEHRIAHSLDSTINVGNPICPEGHKMELFEEEE